MRQSIYALMAALLAACAGTPAGPDSPYFEIPEGSTAVLERPVTVPSPGVSVWIQDGNVVRSPDRWRPACKLEMWTRPEESRTVEPDTFRIARVNRERFMVAVDDGLRRVLFDRDDGGPTAFEMRTFLYLNSERQPEVYRLVCAHWDDPYLPDHLTFNDMRDTLQGIFRLELP